MQEYSLKRQKESGREPWDTPRVIVTTKWRSEQEERKVSPKGRWKSRAIGREGKWKVSKARNQWMVVCCTKSMKEKQSIGLSNKVIHAPSRAVLWRAKEAMGEEAKELGWNRARWASLPRSLECEKRNQELQEDMWSRKAMSAEWLCILSPEARSCVNAHGCPQV